MMHIAIEGMDAVGKTTTAKLLAGRLEMKYYSKSLHAMRDASGIYDSFVTARELAHLNLQNSAFGFRGSFLLSRATGEDSVSDRFLTSNFWAHTHGKHYDELVSLMELAGEPELTVILYARPEIIRKRMVERNPEDKDLVKLPYIEEAYETMLWFAKRAGLHYLLFDTSELTIEEVVEQLAAYVEKRLPREEPHSEHLSKLNAGGFEFSLLDGTIVKECRSINGGEVLPIPEAVTEIRPFALRGCGKVAKVVLPQSVIKISPLSFLGLNALREIDVSENNPAYRAENGILYAKGLRRLVKCPASYDRERSLVIHAAEIDNFAFQRCVKIESLRFAEHLRRVGFGAFLGCEGLKRVTFDHGAEEIGKCAMIGTHKDLSCSFPKDGRYTVMCGAVIDREKESVYYAPNANIIDHHIEGIRDIGPWAFANCDLGADARLALPVNRIGPYAFYRGVVKRLSLPEQVCVIDDGAFMDARIEELILSSPLPPEITSYTMDGSNISRIVLPSADALDRYADARHWCKLQEVLEVQSE